MTHDDAELVVRLCTQAGMLMEDASATAINMASQSDRLKTDALITLSHAHHTIGALIAAAIAIDYHARA